MRAPEISASNGTSLRSARWPVVERIGERSGVFMRLYGASHSIDIAATAEHHELVLATLNTKHFPMFSRLKPPY